MGVRLIRIEMSGRDIIIGIRLINEIDSIFHHFIP